MWGERHKTGESSFKALAPQRFKRRHMPLDKHYKGHGNEVMESMRKTYGNKDKAEQVFYALENKLKKKKKKKSIEENLK